MRCSARARRRASCGWRWTLSLLLVVRQRRTDSVSFTIAIVASLLCTPVVWLHYLELLVVPIAVARPRLSALWLVPLATYVVPADVATGWEIAVALAVVAAVVAAVVRHPADYASRRGSRRAVQELRLAACGACRPTSHAQTAGPPREQGHERDPCHPLWPRLARPHHHLPARRDRSPLPIGVLARRFGRPLRDPRPSFGSYVVRGPAGVFACPAGANPFFLGVGSDYEPGLCDVIDSLDGGVAVDVGASVGFITARLARRVDLVIAVEPHPERFEFLKRNIEANGLTNVVCVNSAAGSSEGRLELFDVDPSLGPHPLDVSHRKGGGREFTVPLGRLDHLVGDVAGDVVFIKIDVEGYEAEVLRGAERVLEQRPSVVVEVLDEVPRARLGGLLPGYTFVEIDPTNWLAAPATDGDQYG